MDTTAPTFSKGFSEVVTEEAQGIGADTPIDYTLPTATDTVDTQVDVVSAPGPGTTFTFGNTTVSCTATDDAGKSAKMSFKVSVGEFWKPCAALGVVDHGMLVYSPSFLSDPGCL